MAKKILNKVKESMQTRQNERKTKKVLDDAYKVRDIIMSVKNRSQFFVAEKTVENFIKKWDLTEDSPEVTFLNRYLNIKKKSLRLNRMNESGEDPGRLKGLIKKILKEQVDWESGDFGGDKRYFKLRWSKENDFEFGTAEMSSGDWTKFVDNIHDMGGEIQRISKETYYTMQRELGNLEEEGSHWDNDPNWGTDKSYWNNDPKWGSSGGGSSNGNTDSGF